MNASTEGKPWNEWLLYEHHQNCFNCQLHVDRLQHAKQIWRSIWLSKENKSVQICKCTYISITLVQSADQSKRFPTLSHIHTRQRLQYLAQWIAGYLNHRPPDYWSTCSTSWATAANILATFFFVCFTFTDKDWFSIQSFEWCCFSGGLAEYLIQLLLAAMETEISPVRTAELIAA